MKPVHWVGSSREDLKSFPTEVKRDIGFALDTAQRGDKHPSAKPLQGFGGASVLEIVENHDGDTYRSAFEESPRGLRAMAKRRETITNEEVSVMHGSGNVFADLGFADAEELQVKAGLTHQISNRIQALGLTQVQAGERLGIGQPDVSKLMNGRYTGYSTDRLIALLNALDVDVEIVVRPRSESESPRRGRVRVMEAVA